MSTAWIASQAVESNKKECIPSSVEMSNIINENPIPSNTDIYMRQGDSIAIKSIHPKCKYYPTNIVLTPGEVYEFDSGGTWQDGWLPPSTPAGWNGLPLNLFNRISGKNFFLLFGSIGKNDRTAFEIGLKKRWKVPQKATGEKEYLYLFPNDFDNEKFRSNNKEVKPNPLRVRIRKIS